MSQVTELHPQYETAPWWAGRKPARIGMAALALAVMPLAAQAGGITYGHAEVTLGFPNGHVTVGKTWETGPRVVQVTHELPGDDCERHDDEEETVIIEKRVEKPKKVVIIEEEEPEVVIIEKRAAPRQVVVVRETHRPVRHVVVHEHRRPNKVIVVERPRHDHHVTVVHQGGHGRGHGHHGGHHGGYKGGYSNQGGNHRYESRPRDLFEGRPSHQPSQRPQRERGVQHIRVDR